MRRTIIPALHRIRDEPMADIVGGIWLVTVLLSLMHLPSLMT